MARRYIPTDTALGIGGVCMAIGFLAGFLLALAASERLGPHLVAYGCNGADGPIYAYEESDLPPCTRIDPAN